MTLETGPKTGRYKSIVVIKRGGPDALHVVERDLRQPRPGEVRIKILATPICQDDVAVRIGNRPVLPKIPFVPGYSMLGVVDAIGEGVHELSIEDRVAALTQFGCHAERIYLEETQPVHVPSGLDTAQAVVLILNYLVAYQSLHRVAQVK
jgi:NADPH2:quinone reductase